MSRDIHDTLIDQMLRELLGGDRPRDLTQRVLARARLYDKVRRQYWVATGGAIAAAIAIMIGIVMLWPKEYPRPTVVGPVYVNNGDSAIGRGSRVTTSEEGASLALGGYVSVEMAPHTVLTIGGGRFEEKVLLEQGEVDVNVTKNRGRFDVAVGKAVVRVIGTKFQVGVTDEEIDDRWVKKMRVAVLEGAVSLDLGNGSVPQVLSPGPEKVFDLSPEPTRVEQAAAPEPLRPGGFVAAMRAAQASGGDGARPGLIRGNFTRATAVSPSGAGPGRGVFPGRGAGPVGAFAGQGAAPPVPGKNVQIVTNRGVVEMAGMLRHDRESGLYYLTPDQGGGEFLVFPQQAPMPPVKGWGPGVSRRMRVTWKEGVVQKIEPAGPAGQSGAF